MTSDVTKELRNEELRQHIGPAVKELRERKGWSLRDLGARCGVSSAYLSRIERGASVPSFSILANIASAFDVSPDYFIEFERSAKELESALAGLLDELAVPRSTWHEFADLSMEAQGALVDAFARLTAPMVESDARQHSAEMAVLTEGVERALPLLTKIAIEHGLTPVDFARHRTQIEEIDSDRFIVLDRLCTLPVAWLFDQQDIFRGIFGVELEDPIRLKWWVRAQRSALIKMLDGSVSRAIYPKESISHYIRTGKWGSHLQFDAETVRQHVEATVKLLRLNPTYQIGLRDEDVPIRMIGKVNGGVLMIAPEVAAERTPDQKGIALRFSGPQATSQFSEYFDILWNGIPEDQRDSEKVATWLETELEAGLAGTTNPA
jgi:transcriptional regulator with XRE-family HTH domain